MLNLNIMKDKGILTTEEFLELSKLKHTCYRMLRFNFNEVKRDVVKKCLGDSLSRYICFKDEEWLYACPNFLYEVAEACLDEEVSKKLEKNAGDLYKRGIGVISQNAYFNTIFFLKDTADPYGNQIIPLFRDILKWLDEDD